MALKDLIGHLVLKYLAVPSSPKVLPGKKHIACIGDSITFGAGVNGTKAQTWEYFLNEILGDEAQVINYGISGRTLQDEGDYPYKADKFYKESKACLADVYLIMLGTNDSKPYSWKSERYEKELRAFVKEYQALDHQPKVILTTPPTCFRDPKTGVVAFDILEETIEGEICPIIRSLCEELHLEMIDLHEFTQGHAEWFTDGVHPNEEGNRRIAEKVAKHGIIQLN